MRRGRVVPGGDVYGGGIPGRGRLEAYGQDFPDHVSHLRLGALLEPIGRLADRWIGDGDIRPADRAVRHGMLYMVLIFLVEYTMGAWLTTRGICPWDYSGRHSNVNGLIVWTLLPCGLERDFFLKI